MQVQANEVIALKEFLQLSEKALSTWVYHKVVAASWLQPVPSGTVKMKLERRQMKAALFAAKSVRGLP